MANTIIVLKHSTDTGNIPSDLANGELAINTYDGKLFYRGGSGNTIQTIEKYDGPGGTDGDVQFNDSGTLNGDSGLNYNKTTDILTVVGGVITGGVNVAPTISSAYNHSNAAFDWANAAYDAANSAGGGGATYTIDTAPPTSGNTVGDQWIDSATGITFTWLDDGDSYQWIELGPTPDAGSNGTGGLSISSGNVSVTANIVPTADITYDLGTPSLRWRDLFLSGNTINLGGASISTDATTGAIALVPSPTDSNPNPSGIVVNPSGAVVTVASSGGVIDAGDLAAAGNSTVNEFETLTVTANTIANNITANDTTVTSLTSSGTLDVTGTSTVGVINASGLASLDAGIDVDGAFTVADTSGNITTSGTLNVTGTSTLGVINASGLASLDAGIDVDGAFTVADSTGDVATTGTLSAGETTLTSATISDLTSGRIVLVGTSGAIEDNANLTFNGTTLALKGALTETKIAIAASDIDLSKGNYFTKTISGATTLTVSNVAASGNVSSFILELTNGGSATVTWFSGVTWPSATAPTLTSSGVDDIGFFTTDGGTTWRGFVLGQGMA